MWKESRTEDFAFWQEAHDASAMLNSEIFWAIMAGIGRCPHKNDSKKCTKHIIDQLMLDVKCLNELPISAEGNAEKSLQVPAVPAVPAVPVVQLLVAASFLMLWVPFFSQHDHSMPQALQA